MRIILLTMILFVLFCDVGMGPDDFDQGFLKGTWIRVVEKNTGISGFYTKDTTNYRIGIDEGVIPDTVARYARWDYPLSYVIEKNGFSKQGYIEKPREKNYDELGAPIVVYTWVELTAASAIHEITIKRPMSDSLVITEGTETFGLKRR